jgi:hypothetical protein
MESDNGQTPLPFRLVNAIREGRCIAFVGAGFSQVGGLPSWSELVRRLVTANEIDEVTRRVLNARPTTGMSSHELDELAQRAADALGERFHAVLKRVMLQTQDRGEHRMLERLRLLRGIPFRAILTLNFDDFLVGEPLSQAVYGKIMRCGFDRWDRGFWFPERGKRAGAPVVNLHGNIEHGKVVLTRRGYREQVHGDRAYLPFLRAMFGHYTVLYLGYSFSDAYLNELRSELLALYDHDESAPLGYAFQPDADKSRREYWKTHEGIELIPYSSEDHHVGFDTLLTQLHQATHPVAELARVLSGKRVLWLDKHPENNEVPRAMLLEAVPQSGGEGGEAALQIVEVPSVAQALGALAESRFDLVLTHWGDGDAPDGGSNAEALLRAIRAEDHRVPVIVFAKGTDVARRKSVSLGLGAQAYLTEYQPLFETIVRVLSDDAA